MYYFCLTAHFVAHTHLLALCCFGLLELLSGFPYFGVPRFLLCVGHWTWDKKTRLSVYLFKHESYIHCDTHTHTPTQVSRRAVPGFDLFIWREFSIVSFLFFFVFFLFFFVSAQFSNVSICVCWPETAKYYIPPQVSRVSERKKLFESVDERNGQFTDTHTHRERVAGGLLPALGRKKERG